MESTACCRLHEHSAASSERRPVRFLAARAAEPFALDFAKRFRFDIERPHPHDGPGKNQRDTFCDNWKHYNYSTQEGRGPVQQRLVENSSGQRNESASSYHKK